MELTNEFEVGVPVEQAWAVLTDVERIAPCLPGAQLQEIEGEEYRGIVKVKVGPITAQYKGKATFVSKDQTTGVLVLLAEGRDTRGQGNASATITATLTEVGDRTKVGVVTDLTITGKVAQFGRGVLVDVSGKLLTQFVQCLEQDLSSGPAVTASAEKSVAGSAAETDPAAAAAEAADTDPVAAGMVDAIDQSIAAEIDDVDPAMGDEAVGTATDPSAGPVGETVASAEPSWTAGPAPMGGAAPMGEPQPEPSTIRKIEHKVAAPVDLFDAAGVPVAKRAVPAVAIILLILWFLRQRRQHS